MTTQRCTACGLVKPLLAFSVNRTRSLKIQSECKTCKNTFHKQWKKTPNGRLSRKKGRIKEIFNISFDEYMNIMQSLWIKQKGCCAICGDVGTSYGKHLQEDPTTLHLDHNHTTGQLRSLLCSTCNTSLGGFKDDHILLNKAAEYLKSYQLNYKP